MFARKLTISDETLKKNELNRFQKGELRYKRLKELDESGDITKIKSRVELAEALGYPRNDRTGLGYVANMIRRGYIKDIPLTTDKGKIIHEYHTTNKEPNFDFKNRNQRGAKTKRKTTEEKTYKEPVRTNRTPVVEAKDKSEQSEITITKGDMTITLKLESNKVLEVINLLLTTKGE